MQNVSQILFLVNIADEIFIGMLLIYFMSTRKGSEKAMAPYSSTLAWKIPWTEEPGRLQSMGSLGVGYD